MQALGLPLKLTLAGALLLSSTAAVAEGYSGVVCAERTARPIGARVSFLEGRGSRPVDFQWSGLWTTDQEFHSEAEWPLGTYAGVSPYGEPVVLTIHSILNSPEPKREFLGTMTYFEYGQPRIDPVDCYFSE